MNALNDNTYAMERLLLGWQDLYDCAIEASVVTTENVYEGARVLKGPDYQVLWNHQNVGVGIITTSAKAIEHFIAIDEDDVWIQVRWEDGGSYGYRISPQHDLIFAQGQFDGT